MSCDKSYFLIKILFIFLIVISIYRVHHFALSFAGSQLLFCRHLTLALSVYKNMPKFGSRALMLLKGQHSTPNTLVCMMVSDILLQCRSASNCAQLYQQRTKAVQGSRLAKQSQESRSDQLADHKCPGCSLGVVRVTCALQIRIPVLPSEPVALPSLLCGLILLMCISGVQSPKSPFLATSRRLPSTTLVPTHLC